MMNLKKKTFLIGLLSFLVFGLTNEHSYGNTNEDPPSHEEIFTEIGYKAVDVALDEFEKHFSQQLKLPLRVPPLSFTHQFGRFSNLDGEMNDTFEVKFISDQFPENHFKIDVRPLKHKIDFSDKPIPKAFELNNGVTAIYADNLIRGFNLFIFDRDGWQYMFSIDKRVSNTVTPEMLVQIANSIDY